MYLVRHLELLLTIIPTQRSVLGARVPGLAFGHFLPGALHRCRCVSDVIHSEPEERADGDLGDDG